jgi:hypothetical protein
MEQKKRSIGRLQAKSSEGEFIYELENSYELSPKISEQILLTAKECLLRENILKEGQIEVTVVGIEEKAGRMIEKMARKKVRLTIDNGSEDLEVKKAYGRIALRQTKIQRITEEAIEQGGLLSQEDLAKYLSCTERTIQRDICQLRGKATEVMTRGYLHNIGKGQTHKVKIIGMYLDGMTFSEIKQKARHSIGAIKRYIDSFSKVVAAQKRGIYQRREISAVTGLSEYLVGQYSEVIKEGKKDKIRKSNIEAIADRMGVSESRKKTVLRYSEAQAAMMRG